MESEIKYFNVPIQMLKGVLTGEKNSETIFLQEIVYYSLYEFALRLPYSDTDEFDNKMTTQIQAAANFLNVDMDIDTTIREGERLYQMYGKHGAFCNINTSILWDYHDNPKTGHQRALFCAFCATKSILGKGRYKRTNKGLILARMFGYNNYTEFETDASIISIEAMAKRKKYSHRYHIDKILTDLELNWGLKRYGDHIRGMYISYKADLTELAKICEKSKRNNKEVALKEAKSRAKETAKKHL